MAGNDPFIRGENAVLRVYQQRGAAVSPIYIPIKNWKINENATEVVEGVQGENRDRLDKVTNYYDITFDAYLQDIELWTAISRLRTQTMPMSFR